MRNTLLVFVALALLSGCASPSSKIGISDTFSDSGSLIYLHQQFLESARNAEISFASHPVRNIYAEARKNFRVTLSKGVYQSTDAALLRPFDHAKLLSEFIVFGELVDSSPKENLVGALLIGSGEYSELEIVVFEQSGSVALHRVSYPLGHAELLSLRINNGFIHATVRHRLLSDPTERTTKYVLGPEKPSVQ